MRISFGVIVIKARSQLFALRSNKKTKISKTNPKSDKSFDILNFYRKTG